MGVGKYALRHRAEWLNKIGEAGVRRRAEFFYQQLDALRKLRQAFTKGMKPAMARLTLARKIAAITLTVWKKGAHFDAKQLKLPAA